MPQQWCASDVNVQSGKTKLAWRPRTSTRDFKPILQLCQTTTKARSNPNTIGLVLFHFTRVYDDWHKFQCALRFILASKEEGHNPDVRHGFHQQVDLLLGGLHGVTAPICDVGGHGEVDLIYASFSLHLLLLILLPLLLMSL